MFAFRPSVSKADALATLQQAIQQQRVVQFKLDEQWRTLAPYKLGYWPNNPQQLQVYGYCRDVATSSNTPSRWQLFSLENMEQLTLTAYWFEILIDYTDPVNQPDAALSSLIWLPNGIKQIPQRIRSRR